MNIREPHSKVRERGTFWLWGQILLRERAGGGGGERFDSYSLEALWHHGHMLFQRHDSEEGVICGLCCGVSYIIVELRPTWLTRNWTLGTWSVETDSNSILFYPLSVVHNTCFCRVTQLYRVCVLAFMEFSILCASSELLFRFLKGSQVALQNRWKINWESVDHVELLVAYGSVTPPARPGRYVTFSKYCGIHEDGMNEWLWHDFKDVE